MESALIENCIAAKEEYFKSLTKTRVILLMLYNCIQFEKNFDDAIRSEMQVEKEITASKLATGVTK